MSIGNAVKQSSPDIITFIIDAAFKLLPVGEQHKEAGEEGEPNTSELEYWEQQLNVGTEQPTTRPAEKVYGAEAKSYKGQTGESYCIECSVKHSQTAKVLMREALQRADAGGPHLQGVVEKVRGVVEELCGMEDDTTTVSSQKVTALNSAARELRKFIYTCGAEMGKASVEDLRKIKAMLDQLVDATYIVRSAVECPACETEEVCGTNTECIDFLVKSAGGSQDKEKWKRSLEEARRRFGGKP